MKIDNEKINAFYNKHLIEYERLKVFFLLKQALAQVIEGLIIMDRLLYLHEQVNNILFVFHISIRLVVLDFFFFFITAIINLSLINDDTLKIIIYGFLKNPQIIMRMFYILLKYNFILFTSFKIVTKIKKKKIQNSIFEDSLFEN